MFPGPEEGAGTAPPCLGGSHCIPSHVLRQRGGSVRPCLGSRPENSQTVGHASVSLERGCREGGAAEPSPRGPAAPGRGQQAAKPSRFLAQSSCFPMCPKTSSSSRMVAVGALAHEGYELTEGADGNSELMLLSTQTHLSVT